MNALRTGKVDVFASSASESATPPEQTRTVASPTVMTFSFNAVDRPSEAATFREDTDDVPVVPARSRRKLRKQIGFQPEHPRLYRAYNIAVATMIVIAAMPLLVLISLALFATQGGEILYRGPRLGKDSKVFQIYKFRTLNTAAAAQVTRDRTLPKNSGLETPLGKFLRDTRLDELPQIFNVLRGDMNLCGPRPVRPEIAGIESARIPGYATRFTVKPGLVGPAQALMSHGTSKRIRGMFNNTACRRPVSMKAEVLLLAAIGWAVLRRSASEFHSKVILRLWGKVRALGSRIGDLIFGVESYEAVEVKLPGVPMLQKVVLHSAQVLEIPSLPSVTAAAAPHSATLVIRLPNGGVRRARVFLRQESRPGRYVFTAASPASEHVVERYLLGLTVLGPTRRRANSDRPKVRFG